MRFLIWLLRGIVALALVIIVVLWFAARRGDRGLIEEEITIARPTSVVFRWIRSEELARRWISDVIELRKNQAGEAAGYSLVQVVNGRRVEMTVRIASEIPNQELDLLTSSGAAVSQGFSGDARFKLIAGDDYTRLLFNSHTQFAELSDRILEPVYTIAMQRKIRDDLARLKILLEAER